MLKASTVEMPRTLRYKRAVNITNADTSDGLATAR
jgi:hypothetical protein